MEKIREEQLPLPIPRPEPRSFEAEASSKAIAGLFEELKLKRAGEEFAKSVRKMTESDWLFCSSRVYAWLAAESAARREASVAAKIKSAKFRRIQTLDAFDFKYSKATEKIEKSYRALHSSMSREALPSAVFTGTAGLGKTHLARALGYAACQRGLSSLFVTAAEMVNRLSHAQKTFALEQELGKYRRPHVLIVDELGYVSLDAQASNLFFQVISARHDAGLGTIATTNLPFGKFNQIFANDAIAHAIVDRLVNDAEVFYLEGDSYREHQRKQKTERRKKQNA